MSDFAGSYGEACLTGMLKPMGTSPTPIVPNMRAVTTDDSGHDRTFSQKRSVETLGAIF